MTQRLEPDTKHRTQVDEWSSAISMLFHDALSIGHNHNHMFQVVYIAFFLQALNDATYLVEKLWLNLGYNTQQHIVPYHVDEAVEQRRQLAIGKRDIFF